jgi:hypothetical protein
MNIRPKYVAVCTFSCARQRYKIGDPVDHPVVLDTVLRFGERFVTSTTTNRDAVDDGDPGQPPRSGAGSGIAAWQTYAALVGIDIADDATRDDIIAAVDAAAPSDGDPPEDQPTPPESSAPEVTS